MTSYRRPLLGRRALGLAELAEHLLTETESLHIFANRFDAASKVPASD
jgi:hypothetical protein